MLQIYVCVYTNNIYRMSATVLSVLHTLTYFNLLTTREVGFSIIIVIIPLSQMENSRHRDATYPRSTGRKWYS